ncbi:cytochrome c, mono- and diheme variants family [Burkholderiales bacterium JOSHI_001]|nr:cytochrome c, mono- and diheme variants family [Burkholderiales bacterium JOSHI_001]
MSVHPVLRRGLLGLLALVLLLALATAAVWAWQLAELPLTEPGAAAGADAAERGAYLARVGHCEGCHTARGGAPYAGGRAVATPFGPVYASNLTPDAPTGLGRWTLAQFRRALLQGRSADGRLLSPAFPYTHTTRLALADVDALYVHLRGVAPVHLANRPHGLPFPLGTQAAIAWWRALYFRPGALPAETGRGAAWERGRYLAEGAGHCGACHRARSGLGGSADTLGLAGGPMPDGRWWAPPLGPVAPDRVAERVRWLQTGHGPRGNALGPMAEVVMGSTQHWSLADLQALASYLQSLPPAPPAPAVAWTADAAVQEAGAGLYRERCADCHGTQGQGRGAAYPPLRGSRVVTATNALNLLRVLDDGGFAPVTAGHPRPYGMPPQGLSDNEAAVLMSWLRSRWGHAAGPVAAAQVRRWRE